MEIEIEELQKRFEQYKDYLLSHVDFLLNLCGSHNIDIEYLENLKLTISNTIFEQYELEKHAKLVDNYIEKLKKETHIKIDSLLTDFRFKHKIIWN